MELQDFGFDISINKYLEDTTYPSGSDLADVFIDEVLAENKLVQTETPNNGMVVRTITEDLALKLAKINPALRKTDNGI